MMDTVLFGMTVAMFGVVCLAVGYAYQLTRELKALEEKNHVLVPRFAVGGSSDVDKSEGWMPFN